MEDDETMRSLLFCTVAEPSGKRIFAARQSIVGLERGYFGGIYRGSETADEGELLVQFLPFRRGGKGKCQGEG